LTQVNPQEPLPVILPDQLALPPDQLALPVILPDQLA